MEAIRGDWTELAQNFQRELVDLIFAKKKKEEIEAFILDYVSRLKKGEYDSSLIYKKKITKALNQYTKTTPPHVRAAREVKNFSGRLVRYVLTKDGPKHVSLLPESPDYDYEHYIEKQLGGVSDDLLNSFGIDFEELLMKKKQKSLEGFF
jgi:DNA polymerase-2